MASPKYLAMAECYPNCCNFLCLLMLESSGWMRE